jgi:dihydroxyacetone kinase-like protein
MKRFINSPQTIVTDYLCGLASAYSSLIKVHLNPTFVYRTNPNNRKVAIVSGGGSGHEPSHCGFVGNGMLDAACPGEIFTGPEASQIISAIEHLNCQSVLFIAQNFVGDVISFESATNQLRKKGFQCELGIIDDDISTDESLYAQGHRGLGTVVIAEKVCGAATELGYSLDKVHQLCHRVNLNGKSIGIALSSCTVPAAGKPTFDIEDNELEYGIGIHGEPGRERIGLRTADEIAEMMIDSILSEENGSRIAYEWDGAKNKWGNREYISSKFEPGDNFIALVNGMGSTTISELYIIYNKVFDVCNKRGFKIARNLIGSYVTSLDMQGCSITLLKADNEILELWDYPVQTPSIRWGI